MLNHRKVVPFTSYYAPVAQLDRVSGFEPDGRGFESLRARIETQAEYPSSILILLPFLHATKQR
jgi:hypothetical protein